MIGRGSSFPVHPIGVLLGLAGVLVAFVALRQALGNATEALAITEAIPSLWVLGYALSRRRIEPLGMLVVAGFGIALLLTIASGGSALPLELHRAVFPGAVGLACLTSLALRRPLLAVASSKLNGARRESAPGNGPKLDTADAHHALMILTAIIGITLSADAASQIDLALTVSTSTFGVVAPIASRVIVGIGLAVCALILYRLRARFRNNQMPAARPGSTAQPTK